jgi:hypothetical protein
VTAGEAYLAGMAYLSRSSGEDKMVIAANFENRYENRRGAFQRLSP